MCFRKGAVVNRLWTWGPADVRRPSRFPGRAARLVAALAADSLRPDAILLTHANFGHIGGIPGMLDRFPGRPRALQRAARMKIQGSSQKSSALLPPSKRKMRKSKWTCSCSQTHVPAASA